MKCLKPPTLILGLFIIAVTSCTNSNDKQATADDDVIDSSSVIQNNIYFETDTLLVWNANAVNKEKSRIMDPNDSVLPSGALINGINNLYPDVTIELDHQGHDTLYVMIPESRHLVSEMGSAGAEQYLSQAALNLLCSVGVKYVAFEFKGGPHAQPAIWSEKDFADWKEVPAQ